jgi:CubicO group peptidase (beta-lactamase class C family)
MIYKRVLAALSFAVMVASLCAASPAAPSVTLPDTPAARVFSAWLDAFNSGDRAKVTQFYKMYRPDKLPFVANEMNFRALTGGFDVRKVEPSTSTAFTALIQERLSDQFYQMTFEVESTPPYQAQRRKMKPVEHPAEFGIGHLTQAELVRALGQRLKREVTADRFAGSVLVAKNGKPFFEHAYGLADRARKIPDTMNTRYRLGSMNKMFTAVAIMQLVQAGKVDLDKPFGTYLTDYPNATVSGSVTIRQLLNHTGGTGDIFGPEYEKKRLTLRTLQDYIALYGNRPLLFPPGSKWDYSNYGFILLGAVIEKVSGENYYDYVQRHIYAPSGMTSTSSDPEDVAVPNRSIGYMRSESGAWVSNADTLPYRGTSAGGGYSTAGDLLNFALALQTHKLLDAAHTDILTTGTIASPIGMYALGFDDEKLNGTRCFGHGGSAPGMDGQLKICPADGYVVVVLANLDPPAADRIADFVVNRLPQSGE